MAFPEANTDYNIISKRSGKYLDIKPAANADGAECIQNDASGESSQNFQFVSVTTSAGDAAYKVKTFANLYLTVNSGSTADGGEIVQRLGHTGGQQKWFVKELNGFCSFKSKKSSKLMDIERGSMDAGAKVLQWELNGGDNQLFKVSLA
jgi:hypothetical protein